MNKTKQKEIINYLKPFEETRIYEEEAQMIEDFCISHFMGFTKNPNDIYTLDFFNAFLDDSRIRYKPRFRFRRDRDKYLKNGEINPRYGESYWILI